MSLAKLRISSASGGVKFANVLPHSGDGTSARTPLVRGLGGSVTPSTLGMNSTGTSSSSLRKSSFAGAAHNPIPFNDVNVAPQNDFARKIEGWGKGYVNVSFNKRKDLGNKDLLLGGLARVIFMMKQAAPDLWIHPQVQGSKLPPITSTEPSRGFPKTLGILFQYFFVQFQWTLDDQPPKPEAPADPNKPNYPDQI